MEVRTMVANEEWTFDIRRRETDGTPVNNIKWDAKAVDENGLEMPVAVAETGLGHFTAAVPLAGKEKLKVLHYTRPSPGEYRLAQSVPPSLAAVPAFSAAGVRANIPSVETRKSVETWCCFLAMACALGSVLLRRL